MALTIYRSNRVEVLQARLSQQLISNPLRNPFAAETIVVPTYAMARWLNLNIARQQGVAANIEYPQAGEWVWSLANTLLADIPARDPYTGMALLWLVFNALPGMLDQPEFASLQRYLNDDSAGIKRWQLSQRIADCFDRYQSYRPWLIRAWSIGEEQHWQAQLWRRIIASGAGLHRVEILSRLRSHFESSDPCPNLPQRINLFALSRLAPTYLDIIGALAKRTDVLFFQHNPTDQYWADLVSDKEQARRRLQDPAQGDYLDSGNRLLSSWGRQGQALQDLLLDLGPITVAEVEDNLPPPATNLLQRLQASLFHLEQARLQDQFDDSVLVQLCHSPLRECQVLHNHILMLLDRHEDLATEDILVMVPEISRYAPYIEAVFQADASHQRPNLAWNISDVSVSDGNPLVQTFLQLLALPGSRFTRSEILSFLDCSEVRDCFGLDASMLEEIHQLIDAAQVRWGISAAHRQQLELPALAENTWQQAWERLFSGYAMADDALWQGIAPISEIDSDSGVAIGRFRYLFERLVYWQQRLAQPATANAWQQRLHQLIDEFLAPAGANDDLLLPLRETISELGQSRADDLSSTLVSYWMQKQLSSTQQPGHLYSGGITFCGMQPLRNIPFAVICVLGMQDNAFPRRQRHIEFDLMRGNWRAGDPHSGDEDRYLMLETLLCARRYLYFSYCARSLKDNSECQPSVLLQELLDYIDSCSSVAVDEPPISDRISHLQPMQAFSARNYNTKLPGYDGFWFDTARLLAESRPPAVPNTWQHLPLAAQGEADSQFDLDALIRFFQHPLRYFYQQRLGIRLPQEQFDSDDEAFTLGGLQKWQLAQQLAEQYLAGDVIEQGPYRARGLLPHGRAADSEWFSVLSEYRDLLLRLEPFREHAAEVRVVDCQLDSRRSLYGEVTRYYPGIGLMHFSASKKIKSRNLISLWLYHLALTASGQISSQERSQLFAPATRGWRYHSLTSTQAQALLGDYIDIYQQGLSYPLPVFPETSYSWASQDDPQAAIQKARSSFAGNDFQSAAGGENSDPIVRLALHNNAVEPWHDPLFQDLARRIYRPAIENGGEID